MRCSRSAGSTGGTCSTVNTAAFRVVEGCRAGGLDRLVALHADYYAKHWSLGEFFEMKVANEAAAFFERYSKETDRAWFVLDAQEAVVGSLIVDGGEDGAAENGAHLRWFILSDECRGQGLGNDLMRRAMDFCDAQGFSRTYLTTFAGLDAARRLYERFGFTLMSEQQAWTWGTAVQEQLFVRDGAGLAGRKL